MNLCFKPTVTYFCEYGKNRQRIGLPYLRRKLLMSSEASTLSQGNPTAAKWQEHPLLLKPP